MRNVSEHLIADLINSGVDTFFGIQGGACARLIENVIKFKGKFIPVLNEQAAGYYAHGYYMANNKTAGLIFTTGPGLTNGISGIAACYYDRVPLVTLVGQVPKRLNIAKQTRTRMVGFQEVPHLDICKPISDFTYKIEKPENYLKNRNKIISNVNSKVQTIEILDDVQRKKIFNTKALSNKTYHQKKFVIQKNIDRTISNSKYPIILVGAGLTRLNEKKKVLDQLKRSNINFATSWGGQTIQEYISNKYNYLGLFGNHNPGLANEEIKKADLIIALGCSLLQHQVGKNYNDFAPLSKIIFVNNDNNECRRAKLQFGKRLIAVKTDSFNFLKKINKSKTNKPRLNYSNFSKSNSKPITIIENLLRKAQKNSIFFSDAGATLSWTYQAANRLYKCPEIYTAFNLHSMGYANCAAIGASINKKNVYCIIGDGSLPMNSQEISWYKKYPIKMIIIDNKGYGIIRQTQKLFYNSRFIASDFINKDSSLPNFDLSKILNTFDIPFRILNEKKIQNDLTWFVNYKKSCALIAKIKYDTEVKT